MSNQGSSTRSRPTGASSGLLALLGGEPLGAPEPEQHPTFTPDAIARVVDLLKRGDTVGLSKANPTIGEAEAAIAAWHQMPHCLGVATGHAALHAALIGLEITNGAEVITSPFSYGASVACVLHNNAIPVFADVDPVTGLLDPATIEAQITDRTAAILAVHFYGQPADMTAIRRIADAHGLAVIEDGSQAHGALHQGRSVGSFGDAAAFSCMGLKPLGASEAGYVLTPREDVFWKAVLSTQHVGGTAGRSGRSADPGFPDALLPYRDSLNYTYRLSTLNAALLIGQLSKVDEENRGKQQNVAYFRDAMAGVDSVSFPIYPEGDAPVYYMLGLNFDPDSAEISRDLYLEALRAEGLSMVFAHIQAPIARWERLRADTGAPLTMWHEAIRRSGRNYADADIPNCEIKVARAVELMWNYISPDRDRMRRLADVFHKVEENLPALREEEQRRAALNG